MTFPSLEGFTQKPVIARTMRVTYPNVASAFTQASSFETDNSLTKTPNTPADFEAEAVDGLTAHISIDAAAKHVELAAGTWKVHFEATISSADAIPHKPNIAIVDGTAGTKVMLMYDSGGEIALTNLGFVMSLEAIYTSTDPIFAKLRLASEIALPTQSGFSRISITFTRLMYAS